MRMMPTTLSSVRLSPRKIMASASEMSRLICWIGPDWAAPRTRVAR
jgi:hypothetical protein